MEWSAGSSMPTPRAVSAMTPLRTALAGMISAYAAVTILAVALASLVIWDLSLWVVPALALVVGIAASMCAGVVFMLLHGWLAKQAPHVAVLLFGLSGFLVSAPVFMVSLPTRVDFLFVPIAALMALPCAFTLAGGWLLFTRYIDGGAWRP